MKTYNQKEAWVLNKRSGRLTHGILLLDGIQPSRLITAESSYKIDNDHMVYYNAKDAVNARDEYKIAIKELCAETKRNIKKLEGLWLESMTREEAIIEAGIEYSIQNSPYCIGGDNFYEKARELNRNKSFEAGVIWADKNPISPWISVKDDLPCNHEELIIDEPLYKRTKPIVCNKPHGISVDQMVYNISRNEWYWTGETPTHWFSAPKLPKE